MSEDLTKEEDIFSDLDRAIFAMFSTEYGQIVLKEFESQLREASFYIGEEPLHAVYREGRRETLRQLINTYEQQKG